MESSGRFHSKKGLMLAFLSGVLACLAGTFGKFALNSDEVLWLCESICSSSKIFAWNLESSYSYCSEILLFLQILAFLVMILLNLVMWTVFVKALHICHTSLEATVTNTAANFFSSALVGRLLFDETNNGLLWWLGTLLILLGLCLMNYSEKGGTLSGGFRAKKKKCK